jgi:hypothetical protein
LSTSSGKALLIIPEVAEFPKKPGGNGLTGGGMGKKGQKNEGERSSSLSLFQNLGTASFEAVATYRLRLGLESHSPPGGSIAAGSDSGGEKTAFFLIAGG